jgi:antitoxin ChpS
MFTAHLRKVGGSVMLAVPPAILDMVQLQSGSAVNIAVENGRLIVEPETKKRYTMEELLTKCDSSAPISAEDAQWTASAPKGQELI